MLIDLDAAVKHLVSKGYGTACRDDLVAWATSDSRAGAVTHLYAVIVMDMGLQRTLGALFESESLAWRYLEESKLVGTVRMVPLNTPVS